MKQNKSAMLFISDLFNLVTKGNLDHLRITDDVLLALMDYPIEAFEIYSDPNTGEEYIRLKSAYKVKKNKIKGRKPKKKTKSKLIIYIVLWMERNILNHFYLLIAIIISGEISPDDFEPMFDQTTGDYVYRFKKDIAEQKGFMDLIDINFDIVTDNHTGEQMVELRDLPKDLNFQGKFDNKKKLQLLP